MQEIDKKPEFCLCEISYCTADQCLWFRYTDSIIYLLSRSEISSFQPSSVVANFVWFVSDLVAALMLKQEVLQKEKKNCQSYMY